jgi:hypothetical protein
MVLVLSKKTKQKSKQKLSQKPWKITSLLLYLMWWHFLQIMVLHPATTTTLPFCSTKIQLQLTT